MNHLQETVYVFASRYTHNRDTGGAFVVINALKDVWGHLSIRTKDQIIKESKESSSNDWDDFIKWANARH